jgi:eukaryotic-like serine/threonine-protein kinase
MTAERWHRIEVLYHAAYARPPGERAAFLADACGHDDALRGQVQSLLDAPVSDDAVLRRPALGMAHVVSLMALEDMTDRPLGGYHLKALLGAGGMGEVYRAHDPRLGRDVAIKVLPQEFTSDPDRLARFEREARMLAALNHSNICGIYGFEEVDGTRFLVLELVEGKTLAEMVSERAGEAGQALSVREALTFARQIAEALEAAHDKGVIHRDLKPANVKITPARIVKVLDFGLAKTVGHDRSSPDLTHVVSGADGATGARLGTAAYMSPEQARGLSVDKRTDIWAFGVVLFEMIAGRRPFRGEGVADTLAAILKTDPDWSGLPDGVSPDLVRLLRRCLEKDPRRRLQSIGDARVEVEELLGGGGQPTSSSWRFAGKRIATAQTAVAWSVAAVAIATAVILGLFTIKRQEAPAFSFSVIPPPGASLATEEAPIISLDGRRLAFVAYDSSGTPVLYTSMIGDAAAARPLLKTAGASLPFWSPDGREIGFFAQGNLQTVDVTTGGVRTLARAGGPRGGTWNADGVIVFVPTPAAGPSRVSASGNGDDARPVPSPSGRPSGGWFPSFLPDGRHFLEFVPTTSQPENSGVWVVSLETGERSKLVDCQSNAVFAPPGFLLFWRAGSLWAQPFDPDARNMRGEPVAVERAVGLNPVTNQALFSISDSGTLAFFAGAVGQSELVWIGRNGNQIAKAGATAVMNAISMSPDAASVVYDSADPTTGTFDLWQLVFGRPAPEKLTFNPANDVFPLWSTDGKRIAFTSVRERPPQVYQLGANSAGTETLLVRTKLPTVPSGWSRDGTRLFYTVMEPATWTGDIWSVSPGSTAPHPVVTTANDDRYGTPSPDGRWLAYVTNESGTFEVMVQALAGPGFRRQVSSDGGAQPQWRDDGSELFYMGRNRTLMSVHFESRPTTFAAGTANALFATRTKGLEIQGTARSYAASPDGQRFLVANATEESHAAAITVVLNRLAALTR